MTIPGFGDFYKAVHGRVPFPWQERLTARVLEGTWPLPTSYLFPPHPSSPLPPPPPPLPP